MARQSLGRGLSALLGEDTVAPAAAGEASGEIDIDLIDPNPDQPRTRFADKALDELAQSITANGIVQPIVVRRAGNRYQIVAGERRWRAAQRAGLRRIPAAIKEVADDKLLELALIENIQRQELNPIEEAVAYRNLVDNVGLTQEQISERVGKERSLIATSLRLLKLPEDIQDLIAENKLSAGHGRALLLADDPTIQRRVARTVMEKGLSVREAERAIKSASKSGARRNEATPAADANVKAAEIKLMRRFGTNIKILPKPKGSGGRIEIEYYTTEDLDRIYQLMMRSE